MANAPGIAMTNLQASFKHATAAPTRKVAVGGVAGAVSTVVIFLLNTYYFVDKPIPAGVATAITTLLAFVLSYWVPPAPTDQVVQS